MSAPRSPRLTSLASRARAVDGSPPFSDGALHGSAVEVWLDDAAALVGDTEAEFVVDPDARRRGQGAAMLGQLIDGGAELFWAHGDHPGSRALARQFGLTATRTLLHLELGGLSRRPGAVSKPSDDVGEVSIRPRAAYSTSAYSTGDADEWVALNARAFAHHPEQGGVTRADLDALTAESWFDAEDFLLLRDGGELIGYCWLKIENGEGEFYVVGVSPDRQGEGLGRELVAAGMTRLASQGIRTAHLYVEGDNAPALRLYRSFGFTERSVDIQYRRASALLR